MRIESDQSRNRMMHSSLRAGRPRGIWVEFRLNFWKQIYLAIYGKNHYHYISYAREVWRRRNSKWKVFSFAWLSIAWFSTSNAKSRPKNIIMIKLEIYNGEYLSEEFDNLRSLLILIDVHERHGSNRESAIYRQFFISENNSIIPVAKIQITRDRSRNERRGEWARRILV